MSISTAELLPWIIGIVLILAALRAVPRRHSRRRRYAHRRGPRASTSRAQGRQFPRVLLPGEVGRVVDGDSIEAEVSGFGRLSIRLANVDAPEHERAGPRRPTALVSPPRQALAVPGEDVPGIVVVLSTVMRETAAHFG